MGYLDRAKALMNEAGTDCTKSVTSAKSLPETKPLTKRHRLKYPEGQPSRQELAEIEAIVQDKGVCLLYSHVLNDYIAFVKNDSYLKDVPPGFLPYTDNELRRLFGDREPSIASLRLIHEAKKLGGRVIDNEAT